jgi:hypothetical protein
MQLRHDKNSYPWSSLHRGLHYRGGPLPVLSATAIYELDTSVATFFCSRLFGCPGTKHWEIIATLRILPLIHDFEATRVDADALGEFSRQSFVISTT